MPTIAASSGLRTLRATFRSCFRSRARYTVAIPPSPISRSTVVTAFEGRNQAEDGIGVTHVAKMRRGQPEGQILHWPRGKGPASGVLPGHHNRPPHTTDP